MRKFFKESINGFIVIAVIILVIVFIIWLVSGLETPAINEWMNTSVKSMTIRDILICLILHAILNRDSRS